MMMKISKKREKALNLRVDQLNEQVCELVDELSYKNKRIADLEREVSEKTEIIEGIKTNATINNQVINTYIRVLHTNVPLELIDRLQEASYANDLSDPESFEAVALDDAISAVYAVIEKYFPKS
jgi:predicted  nucleic acid-binding Zn-ribbon protein